jgi:hypothetical protein
MDYHNLWLLERSARDERLAEIEAERMLRAVEREGFLTRLIDWLRTAWLEIQSTHARQVSLVNEERRPRSVIYSCPIVISQGQKEQH